MDVTIRKPWKHEMILGIYDRGPLTTICEDLFAGAYRNDPVSTNSNCFCPGVLVVRRENFGVQNNEISGERLFVSPRSCRVGE